VDRVHVRAFLAVDLHVDEGVVELGRDLVVLERLVGHDVAPVAGGVPDAEEDRHVAALRLGERLLTPREPVHGVVRVLAQVRGGLVSETVDRDLLGRRPGQGSRRG